VRNTARTTEWHALAQHWDAKNCAVTAQSLHVRQGVFRISRCVGDMNYPAFEQRAPGCRTSIGLDWKMLDIIEVFARKSVGLGTVEGSTSLTNNRSLIRIADCPKVKSRPADDLEHIGWGSLLPQRLPEFVQQPRILNRDDGLVGKCRHQLDLLFGEGIHFIAGQLEGTDRSSLAQELTSHM